MGVIFCIMHYELIRFYTGLTHTGEIYVLSGHARLLERGDFAQGGDRKGFPDSYSLTTSHGPSVDPRHGVV